MSSLLNLNALRRWPTALLAIMVLLAGCRAPQPTSPGLPTLAGQAVAASNPVVVTELEGQVYFTERQTQALLADVASASTVAMINTGTNQTVAATTSDASGHFRLVFGAGFTPDPTATYYLEAIKGLNANLPGNNAARVRTIARYVLNQGWTSLTNTVPNSGLVVSPATTAVAIAAALRGLTSAQFASLIGSVTIGSPDTFTSPASPSAADFNDVSPLITAVLADNQDPVANIGLTVGGLWMRLHQPLSVTGLSPSSGGAGTAVTFTGTGFDPNSFGNNLVEFNGVAAGVTSVMPTSLIAAVPSAAISGPTLLKIGSVYVIGPNFTVPITISSFSVASASVGSTVVLSGSGFDDTRAGHNQVSFAGALAASASVATPTSLTVTIPPGAVSGPVAVAVAGNSGTSGSSFTIPVVISKVSATYGPQGSTVVITGSGFSTITASNSVWFNGSGATVASASATSLQATVPAGASSGALVIGVAGQTTTACSYFGVTTGGISAFAGTMHPPAFASANAWALSALGGGCIDASGSAYVVANNMVYLVDSSGVITVVAGNGVSGYAGDGGPASSALLAGPNGMAVDSQGNLYVADSMNHRVRMICKTTGTFFGQPMTAGDIYTIAGNGTPGWSGDGAAATSSQLNAPWDVALDSAGNLYIADWGNYRIRAVSRSGGLMFGATKVTGNIYTVVGNGSGSYSGESVAGTSAGMNHPESVAADGAGNVFFTGMGENRVRMISNSSGTLYGVTVATNNVYTVAGNGSSGNSGDTSTAISAMLNGCKDVSVDASGSLFIADTGNNRIRMVCKTAGTYFGTGMSPNNIYPVAGTTSGYSGDYSAASSAKLNQPGSVIPDGAGNLLIADTQNLAFRLVSKNGTVLFGQSTAPNNIYTVAGKGPAGYAGDGGLGNVAQLNGPMGVAIDGAGNVYIADTNFNCIRKMDTSGYISTVVGTGVNGFSSDGTAATSAQIGTPRGVSVDAAGNLFIADSYNHRIRMVPNSTGTYFGRAMNGHAIYTVAGSGINGFSGDGAAATGAQMNSPFSVVLDGSGNLYFSDYGNNRVRMVDPTGAISTIVGTGYAGFSGDGGVATSANLNGPMGLCMDGAGNLYIGDSSNHRIRKVSPTRIITTVAGSGSSGYSGDGGAATSAALSNPFGVTVDGSGNLFLADIYNNCIRKVNTSGVISTVAGGAGYGFAGDGGSASSALLNGPQGVVIDATGKLFVADTYNNCVRLVH